MKQYTVKEFVNILKRNGYEFVRQTGSHMIYRKEAPYINTICITNNKMNCCVAARLIKEHALIV